MTLEVPDALGLSESQQHETDMRWDTYSRVQEDLSLEGFLPIQQPQYQPPQHIHHEALAGQDSRVLTIELARSKAWRDFAANRLLYVEMILLQIRTKKRHIELDCKRALVAGKSKKPTREDVIEQAMATPLYVQLELEEQRNEQFRIAYAEYKSLYSSTYQLVSRVVTLRQQDLEQQNRLGNAGRGPYQP